MKISVKLVGWNKAKEIFDFNVYEEGTDGILDSFDVKDGVVYDRSLIEELGLRYENWSTTADEAASIATDKKYFELVKEHFTCHAILRADSFEELADTITPRSREDLSKMEHRAYVAKCYDLYAREGFAKTFESFYSDVGDYIGSPFKVLREISLDDPEYDLESLPQWEIQFPDGATMVAKPEEIILSEQRC